MPEDNLYSAYKASGRTEGEYTSSLGKVQDTWNVLDYTQRLASAKQDKLSRGVDTIGSALQLGSTLYGGWQDKQKFEGESMPAAQQMIAEQSYDAEKHGGVSWGEFQKGDKYQDYLSGFAPKKVKMGLFESMFAEEPLYDIAGEQFKKSEISLMGKVSSAERLAQSIGTDTSTVLDVQETMLEEASGAADKVDNILKDDTTMQPVIKKPIVEDPVVEESVVQSQGGPTIGGYQGDDDEYKTGSTYNLISGNTNLWQ